MPDCTAYRIAAVAGRKPKKPRNTTIGLALGDRPYLHTDNYTIRTPTLRTDWGAVPFRAAYDYPGHRYPQPLVTATPPRSTNVLPRALPQDTSTRRSSTGDQWWESGSAPQMWRTPPPASAAPNAASGRQDALVAGARKAGRPSTWCLTTAPCMRIGRERRSSPDGHSPPLHRNPLVYAHHTCTNLCCKRSAPPHNTRPYVQLTVGPNAHRCRRTCACKLGQPLKNDGKASCIEWAERCLLADSRYEVELVNNLRALWRRQSDKVHPPIST